MGEITLLSREQKKKKVFIQLGKKFHLPLDIIILLYNSLRKSIYHDRSLQINFHKNILSSHLCGSSGLSCEMDKLFTLKNPFQYRLPIGKGNEWLIETDDARKEHLFYHGLYNELKPRDIICQQIEIYGNKNFILKYSKGLRGRECYVSLEGMERIRFIDRVGIDLFDHYWDYLENNRNNIESIGNSYENVYLYEPHNQEMINMFLNYP